METSRQACDKLEKGLYISTRGAFVHRWCKMGFPYPAETVRRRVLHTDDNNSLTVFFDFVILSLHFCGRHSLRISQALSLALVALHMR